MQAYLWIEFLALFGLTPLLYKGGYIVLPKIPLLLILFLFCLAYLIRRRGYTTARLVGGLSANRAHLRGIALRSLAVAVFCVAAVLLIDPSLLFRFPRSRPWLWLVVMVLYPLLSAYPQELIYRPFLFERYRPILRTEATLTWVSVLAFSFLHVIFGNWIAVVLTIPAGYAFTRTYRKTGSLLLAAVEHAAYGCIVFTTGLGRFFYTPS